METMKLDHSSLEQPSVQGKISRVVRLLLVFALGREQISIHSSAFLAKRIAVIISPYKIVYSVPTSHSASSSVPGCHLKHKPKPLLLSYLQGSASPNASSRSSPAFRSVRDSPQSSPNSVVYLIASDKEVVSRAHNFKQILNRFQNAADGTSTKSPLPRKLLNSPATPVDRRHSHHFSSEMTIPSEERRFSVSPAPLSAKKSPPSLTITIPTPKNNRRPFSVGPRNSTSSAFSASSSSASSSQSDEVVSGGISTPLTSPYYLSYVSVSSPSGNLPTSFSTRLKRLIIRLRLPFKNIPHSSVHRQAEAVEGSSVNLRCKANGREELLLATESTTGGQINRNRENERSSSQLNLDEIGSDISGRNSVNPLYVDDSGNSSSNSVGDKRNSAIIDRYNQITVGHMKTLAFVASNLWEQIHYKEQMANSVDFARTRFSDFLLKSAQPFLVKGKSFFFYASLEGFNEEFTLMIAPLCQYGSLVVRNMAGGNLFRPPVMAEIEDFNGDLRRFLRNSSFERTTSAHRVLVMPHLNICSFHSLAAHHLHKTMDPSRLENVVCFTMIQLLSALKSLQSDGLESLSINFKEFMLAFRLTNFAEGLYDLKEYPQLIFLQESVGDDLDDSQNDSGSEEGVGVCRYALRALCTLLHHKMHLTLPKIPERSEYSSALRIAAFILNSDKSSSLTRAKNILEFAFWVRNTHFDNELEAKLWLDQQRATQIDRLIHLLVEQSTAVCEPKERLFVQFLLSSTSRTLFQSSQSLQDQFLNVLTTFINHSNSIISSLRIVGEET
ncbi:hypothetical protein L596_011172 [Steinernema carpocapsae]|uniref:Uncharacterized protein n=1 Tax=Steinernema carpocapsae TaxID=34508 RepID=A0A4U5NTX9_STECR|nr:hypothetical protein L596_011172 [Steinernema carpocapsae]